MHEVINTKGGEEHEKLLRYYSKRKQRRPGCSQVRAVAATAAAPLINME